MVERCQALLQVQLPGDGHQFGEMKPQREYVGSIRRNASEHCTGEVVPYKLQDCQIPVNDGKILVSGSSLCKTMTEAFRPYVFVRVVFPQWQTQNAATPVSIKGPLVVCCEQTRKTSNSFILKDGFPHMMARSGAASPRSSIPGASTITLLVYRCIMKRLGGGVTYGGTHSFCGVHKTGHRQPYQHVGDERCPTSSQHISREANVLLSCSDIRLK